MVLQPDIWSLRPTQHGVLFVFILTAMLVGAINYNNNAGFILVFLLGGMTLISFVYSLRNLRGMEIRFMAPRPVFAGQDLAFPFRVKAGDQGRWAVGVGSAGARMVFVNLERGMDGVYTLFKPTTDRGRVPLESVALFSVFPLGLFRIRLRMAPGVEGLVYPNPLPGESRFGHEGGSGDEGSRADAGGERGEGVDDFHGLKPWKPGQPMGRIAWKPFSGGRGLWTKDFSSGGRQGRILDYHALGAGDVEFRLSRLCHMAVTAHDQGLGIGLRLPGREIPPPESDQALSSHLATCLRALALYGKGEDQ